MNAVAGTGLGEFWVEAVALWTPRLADWEQARAMLRGERAVESMATRRPDPTVLPPNERRRCPDSVAVALTVAMAACQQAGRGPASLPSVFTSTYGDLAITDYMCSTLASDPRSMSPTRFHNSVHNAAAGYWAIATGCMEPYMALAAGGASFAESLLAALVQARADDTPMLFVAYDIQARGPLAGVTRSEGLVGAALVLSPRCTPTAKARLRPRLDGAGAPTPARPGNAELVAGNAMAACLSLFEALADECPREVGLELAAGGTLAMNIESF